MLTVEIFEGQEGIFKNPDEAIEYIIETNFKRHVYLYAISSNEAYTKIKKIYEFIKEYNKGKSLDDQILLIDPYEYRGILGCLEVQVYEIGFRAHNGVSDFDGDLTSMVIV